MHRRIVAAQRSHLTPDHGQSGYTPVRGERRFYPPQTTMYRVRPWFCTSDFAMVCLAVAMLLAWLLGIDGSAGAQQNASAMKALREKLLGEKSDMDPSVPPSTSQDNKVWVQFRIFKVLGVDLQSGRLRFKAWRRTRWFDDRLAWDPVSAWLPCPRASHRTGSSPLVCIVRRSSTVSTRYSSIREVLRPQTWTTSCGCRT